MKTHRLFFGSQVLCSLWTMWGLLSAPVVMNLTSSTCLSCICETFIVSLFLFQAEQDLKMTQSEFDRQAEITRLLLEGIGSTHVSSAENLPPNTVLFYNPKVWSITNHIIFPPTFFLSQAHHLRCLNDFVEAQMTYYAQCYQYMVDLQKQLGK